ncbi:MAG: DUF4188 domain-containing protein [Cyanobacteria bacterium P01_D01_bin.36]
MDKTVFPGRYTANVSEPCVVFLIGMRVNRFWAIKKWFSVASAMGPMMTTLSEHPEKGLLGSRMFFRAWPLETCMVSYWRSFEDLTRFARSQNEPHWQSWQQFISTVGNDGSVGIWHETYKIEPANCECIYGNMPAYGLAAATAHIPISKKTRNATNRMATSA